MLAFGRMFNIAKIRRYCFRPFDFQLLSLRRRATKLWSRAFHSISCVSCCFPTTIFLVSVLLTLCTIRGHQMQSAPGAVRSHSETAADIQIASFHPALPIIGSRSVCWKPLQSIQVKFIVLNPSGSIRLYVWSIVSRFHPVSVRYPPAWAADNNSNTNPVISRVVVVVGGLNLGHILPHIPILSVALYKYFTFHASSGIYC